MSSATERSARGIEADEHLDPSPLRRAFGLDLDSAFTAPGLERGTGPALGRRARLELVPAAQIDSAWPLGEGELIAEWQDPEGGLEARLDTHESVGYRDYTREYGSYLVDHAGQHVACAPPPVEDWRWQRYLIAQILPLAAVLQGLEVLHASAVAVGDRALGFVGVTEAGKTSLAINLVLRAGARLLTDDVLVLEPGGGPPLVQPGAGVVSVRRAEAQVLGAARLEELGRRLGDDGEAVRIHVDAETRALPLGALYLLKRGEAERLAIERIPQPDPRLLLASTFNFFVRTPARMTGQLDACARVATQVPMFWAHVPADLSAAELAKAVAEHAGGEAEPQ